MLGEMLACLHKRAPLIHCITNYVTINDCANVLLACGASPVMADDEREVCEITEKSNGLLLNLGTLDQRRIPAMRLAAKTAAGLGHPIVLDPVGAGASSFRTETALAFLREIPVAAVRGNCSELRALSSSPSHIRGVDAGQMDQATEENLDWYAGLARQISAELGTIVVMTGAIDLVSDSRTVFCIRNGHPMMSRVTGTGCQLSAMTAAFLSSEPGDDPGRRLLKAAAAVCSMGLCGEKAWKRMRPKDGTASYRDYLADAVFRLTPDELERGARYEMR